MSDRRTDLDRRLLISVAALAGNLRAAGVRRGDVVAWQLPNSVEAVLLFRACWRLGAVAAPLHHQLGPAETAAMVGVVKPAVAFSASSLPLAEHPGVRLDLADLPSAPPVAESPARPSDLAVVLFTSGSTGEPKAVLHTHRGLAEKAVTLAAAHQLRPNDAVLMPAPLAHVAGLLNGVLLPAVAGVRCVLMERWDPERANRLVHREQITFMIGPPAYFSTMADAPGFSAEAVRSLRLVSLGSTTISPSVVEATRERFGAEVKRTYGSTEAPNLTTSVAGDPPERARDTDGRVVGQAELRVVDPSTGRALPPGQPGELLVRGPELFAGYVSPEQTASSLRRGWFCTGDLAVLDAEGWLTIVGRSRELIIRGGENVVPAEIEQVLEAHPAVRQALVVGYPDPHLGERIAVCVVASSSFDLEACRAWCAERGVARFKTPERVVHVDALPSLSLGKPDRSAVRKLVADP